MSRGADAALELFAVTAPGLEQVCAAELAALGIPAAAQAGGVAWRGAARTLYRANLELRTASRVVARAGEFRARTFAELERHAAKLPWPSFLKPGAAVVLRVTCRKSKLYHEGAVAERIARVLAAEIGARVAQADTDTDADADTDEDERDVASETSAEARAQLVVVRFFRDTCTISIDASGALLHQRGYRRALAQAPLRETLAAALLLATGWRGGTALLDPLCGSATIPIEAALLARAIAPGLASPQHAPRAYAFEQWPDFDAALWSDVVAAARAAVRGSAGVPILGSDRHGGAIAAAAANAARAGVADDVRLERRALSMLERPAARGHLITNPPYGVRVGERRALHALYAALGRTARERLPGWTVALLAADERLAAATALPLAQRLATRNGGIAVRLLSAHIPG